MSATIELGILASPMFVLCYFQFFHSIISAILFGVRETTGRCCAARELRISDHSLQRSLRERICTTTRSCLTSAPARIGQPFEIAAASVENCGGG